MSPYAPDVTTVALPLSPVSRSPALLLSPVSGSPAVPPRRGRRATRHGAT